MPLVPAVLTVVLAVVVAGCASTAESDTAVGGPAATAAATAPPPPTPSAVSAPTPVPTPEQPAATAGAWVDQAAYDADRAAFHAQGDVVLFFSASWCPTCQQTVRNLDAQGVPPGLTVVRVDYDDADALRQQYQVTVQHTFVQVDQAGQQVAKFTGSLSGAEIAAETA